MDIVSASPDGLRTTFACIILYFNSCPEHIYRSRRYAQNPFIPVGVMLRPIYHSRRYAQHSFILVGMMRVAN